MNEALREHVTRVGFNLTLGKSHIAALVLINEYWAKDVDYTAYAAPWNHFITGVHGLQLRGLAWHQRHDFTSWDQRPPRSACYGITTAGQYAIGLLAEAGIWQDYLDLAERHKQMGAFRVHEQVPV